MNVTTDLCMFNLQQKLLKMNLRIFIYHSFGTVAGTKINYPEIGCKKQFQSVNNKLNKNFELRNLKSQKKRFSSPAKQQCCF